MKEILLATILLSIAVSENILMENYPISTGWTRDKQFWNRKTKRALRDDVRPEVGEFSNYKDDRQLPQISDTRFISGTMKLPPVALIRRPDLVPFRQITLPSSDQPTFDSRKPTVLIAIGIQGKINAGDDLQRDCLTSKSYRRPNQAWQLQQPFYVEEPRWIEIDNDYINDASHRTTKDNDPYILTRGKKIFKFRETNQLDKTRTDYEEFRDFPSISNTHLSGKNRVRRSVEEAANWKNVNSIENVKNKETDMFGQMKNNAHMEKLDDLDTYNNFFILPRGKKALNNKHERSDKNNKNYKKRNNQAEVNKRDIKTIEPQLANESNSQDLGIKNLSFNYRKKRSICDSFDCQNRLEYQQIQGLKNLEREIRESPYLEQREKHGDILDILDAPFIISRGKKSSHEVADDLYSIELDDDIRNVKVIDLPTTKNLLRMLVERSAKCNNGNCDTNIDRFPPNRKTPRDRRGSLDEILTKYDPFYVARGKRMNRDNFLNMARSL